MENKKTSELLDLLHKKEIDDESTQQEIDDIFDELAKRPPFDKLFGVNKWGDKNDPTHEERLDELEENTKLLKRHKHDDKTGDVMIRI